jgi:TraM recognition site of TraD and TraG
MHDGLTEVFAIDSDSFRRVLPTVFQRCAYAPPNIEDHTRTAVATRTAQESGYFTQTSQRQALIRWESVPGAPSSTRVTWAVYDVSHHPSVRIPGPEKELGQSLHIEISAWVGGQAARQRETPPHNPVVWPGQYFEQYFTGTLLDYSECATQSEVMDLTGGVFPLGRFHYGFSEPQSEGQLPLFLSRFQNGSPMEFNGVLVCAPQNSGKTTLILRWAEATTHAPKPSSVLVIDVKGNMSEKLKGRLAGEVYQFSTDPDCTSSDRINFLAGPEGLNPTETDRIGQLVTALLPSRGFVEAGGENEYYYRNRVIWLTACVHILKLMQFYVPELFTDDEGQERDVDLCDLYEMIADEELLCTYINEGLKLEALLEADGKDLPACAILHWALELAIMLDPARVTIGQRAQEHTYREYTTGLLSALEPYSAHGTLHHRIRSFGEGRLFDLEQVLGRADRPVTVILSARDQDLDKAAAVLSLTVKRLQWFLFNRMSQPDAADRPVLLLLDETRRIRDFDAAQYVTFAREAKAACVIVYQSLDQAGTPAKITELLENVGTQIYLGSLVGQTAKYFQDILPRRWRPSISKQINRTANTETVTTSISREQVEYLGAAELYSLPAGRWPALVYINDQPRRKPILVSMTESSLTKTEASPIPALEEVPGAAPVRLRRREKQPGVVATFKIPSNLRD